MNHILRPTLVVPLLAQVFSGQVFSAEGLSAQDHPKEIRGSFFPQNYTQEYFVDVGALQDTGVWETIERTVFAGTMLLEFRKAFGCRLRDLKTIRGGSMNEMIDGNRVNREVIRFRGTKPLQLPGAREDREPDRIAGFPVLVQRSRFAPSEAKVFVVPRSHDLLFGTREHIEPILQGKRRGGVPHPGLFALTASGKPLAYLAGRHEEGSNSIVSAFEPAWLSGDDPVTFYMLRLFEDPKTEEAIASMTIRFKSGETGPAKLRAGLESSLREWRKDKRFFVFKDLLDRVAFRVDRTDLLATVNLGGPRSVGKLMNASTILPTLLFSVSRDVAVAPVAVPVAVPVEEVKPARDVKKPDAKKQPVKD